MSFLSNQPENINSKQGTGRNSLIRSVARGKGELKSPQALEMFFFFFPGVPKKTVTRLGLGKWLPPPPTPAPLMKKYHSPLCYRGRSETSGLSLGINRFTYVFVVATLGPLKLGIIPPPPSRADSLRLNWQGSPSFLVPALSLTAG